MRSRDIFIDAATGQTTKRRGWPQSYDALVKTIVQLSRQTDDINDVAYELRQAFISFLTNSGFHLAAENFEALLKEKSGSKFLRNDGTVSWYHEFMPIMMVLSAVRKGLRGNGVDLKDIENYGGLEVAIITHLRHDSIEDHITKEELRDQQYSMLKAIRHEGYENYTNASLRKVDLIVENIDMMSQKKLYDADGNVLYKDGKPLKEDVVTYISRLVSSSANPIPFILKQADIAHNFATMFGAEKFSPERRAKRCNEKENMYGPRQNFYDLAVNRWKPFARIIGVFDGIVGDLLYKHFRYLENVDLFYRDSQYAFQREPNDLPVSSRFLRKALMLDLPDIINPLHIGHKRMQNSVNPSDAEKLARLGNFMENVIKPSLQHRADRFPYIFNQTKTQQPRPAPIAFN